MLRRTGCAAPNRLCRAEPAVPRRTGCAAPNRLCRAEPAVPRRTGCAAPTPDFVGSERSAAPPERVCESGSAATEEPADPTTPPPLVVGLITPGDHWADPASIGRGCLDIPPNFVKQFTRTS
ncbi:hypothetical protein GCM10023215_65040 [Pseudonocardia yuanmonensis]|uniref:Uncharacterized protein n=1 Tax=Pseudonocardia yuanmonensis TaxID=1095914 RepID=A0ABP8XSU1_9PSEU